MLQRCYSLSTIAFKYFPIQSGTSTIKELFFFSGNGQEAGFIYLNLEIRMLMLFELHRLIVRIEGINNICESTTEMKDGS